MAPILKDPFLKYNALGLQFIEEDMKFDEIGLTGDIYIYNSSMALMMER